MGATLVRKRTFAKVYTDPGSASGTLGWAGTGRWVCEDGRMSRARLAVAVLLVFAGAAVVLLASVAGASTSKRFHYSHRVVVAGLYVDHWMLDETFPCGRVGEGT